MTGVQTCALPICFPVTIRRGMDEFTTDFIKEIVEHELENQAAKIIEDITDRVRSESGFSYKISKAKRINEEENRSKSRRKSEKPKPLGKVSHAVTYTKSYQLKA